LNKSYLLFVSFFIFVINLEILGQGVESVINNGLVNYGFENVAVKTDADLVYVTYENRMFRSEIDAIEKLMELVAAACEGYGNIQKVALLPQHNRIFILVLSYSLEDYYRFIAEDISREEFVNNTTVTSNIDEVRASFKASDYSNKTFFKPDITVHALLRYHIGNYSNPFEPEFSLGPSINISLAEGFSLKFQSYVPIYNELTVEGNYWRPRIAALNQVVRFPGDFFMSTSVGHFTNHRYGIDLQFMKYLMDGRITFHANLGYTGSISYIKNKFTVTDIDTLTAFVSASYHVPQWDLILKAKFGKFIYQDTGIRFDVWRQFGEVDIGFYFFKTNIEKNGGITLSVPIFPKEYYPNRLARIIPAKNFSTEYRVRGLPITAKVNGASEYKTGFELTEFDKRLNPDYVRNNLFRN